jgi:hypothetical protein
MQSKFTLTAFTVAIASTLLFFFQPTLAEFFMSERDKDMKFLGEAEVRLENEKMFWTQADQKEAQLIKQLGEAQTQKRGAEQAGRAIREQAEVVLYRLGIECEDFYGKEHSMCDFTKQR